jgi:hypothetical protein
MPGCVVRGACGVSRVWGLGYGVWGAVLLLLVGVKCYTVTECTCTTREPGSRETSLPSGCVCRSNGGCTHGNRGSYLLE